MPHFSRDSAAIKSNSSVINLFPLTKHATIAQISMNAYNPFQPFVSKDIVEEFFI